MKSRPVRHPEDLPAIGDLVEQCRATNDRPPLSEHKHRSLFGSELLGRGLLAFEEGRLVGYAHILASHQRGVYELELVVHPSHRDGVTEDLLNAARETAATVGARSLIVWDYGSLQLNRLPGLVPDRRLHELRAELPTDEPEAPAGFTVRPYHPNDESALLYVTNAAFGDHPEAGNWTARDLHEVQNYPWYDSAGIRTAWRDRRLAGFCWTKLHEEGLGEIYLIATDPEFQGLGLGRQIALEGLRYLHEQRGAREGMLYVDAGNRSALRLYEGLGFAVRHTSHSFLVELG